MALVEKYEKDIRALTTGTYILGPSWATKHHFSHTITVFEKGTASYRATPRTPQALHIDLHVKERTYGERVVHIPDDQPFIIVAGPTADFGPLGIFDLCFFARIKLPLPTDIPNIVA